VCQVKSGAFAQNSSLRWLSLRLAALFESRSCRGRARPCPAFRTPSGACSRADAKGEGVPTSMSTKAAVAGRPKFTPAAYEPGVPKAFRKRSKRSNRARVGRHCGQSPSMPRFSPLRQSRGLWPRQAWPMSAPAVAVIGRRCCRTAGRRGECRGERAHGCTTARH
jgi:hypothetical protein